MTRLRALAERRLEPVLVVIAALFAAAVLVMYLQYRASHSLRQEAEMIVLGVSESAATELSSTISRILSGPVEVLSTVNQPELNAGRVDLIVDAFRQGFAEYPQIERFFLWHRLSDAVATNEVLFYDRPTDRSASSTPSGDWSELSAFHRDPSIGSALYRETIARMAQRNFAAIEQDTPSGHYLSVIRVFWANPKRETPFTILGFMVNVDEVRARLFADLHEQKLASLLAGAYDLKLQILDETGREVFASGHPLPNLSATANFRLQFYPEGIRGRMAPAPPSPVWRLIVGPAADPSLMLFSATQAYWLAGLSIALIVLASGFALQGHRRARELARMQSEFVAHVSHQLKTPLSLLSAVLETIRLERVRSPQTLVRYHEILRQQTDRLSALVERVLEFSRIESKRSAYEFERVDLGELVRETVDAFARSLEADGFSMHVKVSAPTPTAWADAAALEQALVNLLDNAVKYSGDDRTIHVEVSSTSAAVTIAVTDRGIGISADEQPHVFDRFYRGAGSSMNRRGFGLGLAICAELVAAHGGRVLVESEPGHGSTFTVRLPREPRRLASVYTGRRPITKAS